MRVSADRVTVAGPHGAVLAPTSLTVEDGELALVHGEPGPGVTAFGLTLTGRMKPSTGVVTVDGAADEAKLRGRTAVVDAPGVSEPEGALPVRVVVGEELALGGHPAGKQDVAAWLAGHDAAGLANVRFENLEPAVRTRLLTELAAHRKGVRMLVLDTPDRHTSDVAGWSALAREHAARGLAVVVLTATTPLASLPGAPARLGEPS
ncbi:ABC transporter ATP-binding protein [Amycolatopsis acidiphila]|uniref:ABC transporter ATP-binding protein n=1 Tax=Amycolatopsis acidiphila TaxID=715473 RepID=A0A558AKP4_9PSEU|nr:ABC transporter ATP-binding protein [Amycolatopsis acidiphila]TVT24817.1 ABC transporter ATP-binding protein [Amycolatopsis acidiphila]UIJ62798.1 ABC transporter ATP-binding protein [Amycolatopsis acidiphila]GHG64260.1 ABC transporter ATP-binding protein [Amycolatopsis acidiphila]